MTQQSPSNAMRLVVAQCENTCVLALQVLVDSGLGGRVTGVDIYVGSLLVNYS